MVKILRYSDNVELVSEWARMCWFNEFAGNMTLAGRNSNESLRFNGEVLMTYNGPLETLLRGQYDEQPIWLINGQKFSKSSSQHLRLVERVLGEMNGELTYANDSERFMLLYEASLLQMDKGV
jgi:hypothetical protein